MVETSKDDIGFKWGRKGRPGGKDREAQFYESFHFDGVEYARYDCVYLYKEGEPEPFVGKLIKIWETPTKLRRAKVLWFFRPCEITNYLGTEQLLENELLLASGEGVGLANVNPLEAIAGKCNVICTSKDPRNLQPSHEELQMADFVFSRTFDVGQRKIIDKIDERICGTEVKFIFNRIGSLNHNAVEKVLCLDKEDEDLGKNALPSEAIVKSLDDLNRPLKKRKLDASEILLGNKHKNDEGKSTDGVGRQASIQSGSASEKQFKNKNLNESPRGEKVLSLKPEEKFMELSCGKLGEVSSHQSPRKDNHEALPVDVDKNTWFKEPPFEDRMQTACEQGTLVLLRNLDPTYVSTEVEDIIWQGFREKCSAKMLPQTTTSSPHSGQAFVIFKTKEAAKRAIKKLYTGCLVLPDGRPLVGCVETPCSPGKQSTFNGHLVISNPKQPQTRETKEAVSTSHFSQPNTIVYDMAMEWSLQQQKLDFILDKLYKKHGMELKKVKAHLKSK
ncbi:hypothetical protein BT93_C0817 [Corymbia citriodora subsp. variegata]|nr:hypothetical protein BT93_C0817 [Corymbia citriodora subsp. variegata]